VLADRAQPRSPSRIRGLPNQLAAVISTAVFFLAARAPSLPTAGVAGSEIADPVAVELYDVDPDGRSQPDAMLPVVLNLPHKVLAGDPAMTRYVAERFPQDWL
jgi:hypothetical protein